MLSSEFIKLKRRFYILLHPRVTVLVTTYCGDNKFNVMPCSWHTPVCWEPDLILIVVDKENFTHKCIMENKEFVINVVDDSYLNKIMKLAVHGDKIDKFKLAGLKTMRARYVRAPVLRDAIAYMEATLYRAIDVEEETLFIGRVLDARIRADVFKAGGWNYNRAKLILHHWSNIFVKVDPESLTEAPR